MDTTRAQQQALDDELVAPADRLKIGKSNLRLSSILKSKEPTLQVALDALKLTPFYNAFEISADVPEIYMQEFWVTVSRHHSLLRQKFEEPPLEEDILSFIRDLGHNGEIKFLSDVNVNHMHKPWRSFAAIINKCLSGKITALEKDLVFQVENKNSKKNNDMYYSRVTKVIVDYIMAKDQAIPRRNKMFWHYARDDFMFTTVRIISKHQDTQVYGAILPQHLTNQAMLESEAYMTYRAYATGEKTPKLKSTKKKADSKSSPKTKPTQASKGKRIKTSAKGDKSAKMKQSATKLKGLTVLSEVALSKADQMKLETKRSKKEFHSSHTSGLVDRVDIQSKVPDEQQQNVSGTNEGVGDKLEVLDVPEYRSESEEESWTFSQGEDDEENDEHDSEDDNDEHDSENDNDDENDDQENVSGETKSDDDGDDFFHPNLSTHKADDQEEEKVNDDDEVSSDQKVSTPPDYEITDEDENQEDDDNVMGGKQEDEELYGDFNLNMDKRDDEMTDAQTNQETKEVHVTLTTEPPIVQQQSSSVLSDLVSKFINPSPNTGINSILNPNVQSDIPVNVSVSATTKTPSSNTTIPQPPILIIQPQQQTHNPTTTTPIPTITLPEIPNFASLREESQAENDEFLKQIDSNIKAIIKDQVKAQVSKIMPKVEKYVTESLGAEVLARSSNQPQTSYVAAESLSEFEQDEEPFAGSNRGTKRRRSCKEESSKEATQKESKSTSSSKGASRSQPNSSGKSAQAEEHGLRIDDLEEPLHQEFNTGNDDVLPVRENARGRQVIPFDHFINNDLEYLKGGSLSKKYTTLITKTKDADYGHVKWIEDKVPRSIWSLAQVVYDKHAYWGTYHWVQTVRNYMDMLPTWKLQKMSTRDTGSLLLPVSRLWSSLVTNIWKRLLFEDRTIGKLTNLNLDERFALNVALRMYTRCIVIQERVEDLQLAVESYQNKINLSKPDSYRSDLRKMTPYTAYHDIQGIIYQDNINRNRLMRTDELYKFSDSTLNHVRIALNDIATRIQMEYLPKRKWSKQDKQRAWMMINSIDKKLRDRRLMRSLEKFVGGRPYRGDLRLLQRTI
ncbi:hypothetical protein Tco_0880534 [Tanacetum coccineum]